MAMQTELSYQHKVRRVLNDLNYNAGVGFRAEDYEKNCERLYKELDDLARERVKELDASDGAGEPPNNVL